jgi:hypothetical protein
MKCRLGVSMFNKKLALVASAATALISSNIFAGSSDSTQGDGIQLNALNFSENDIVLGYEPIGSIGRYYAGIQASSVDDDSGDNSVLTWIGRLGKNINKNFSFEGRLGLPTDTSKTYPYPNWDKSLGIDKLYGVYGVGHSKIGESISAYGLIGYTRVGVTVSTYGLGTKSVDDYDLSFGLGLDKAVGHYWALNIEYIQYLSNSKFDINATAIGATYYF